MERLCRMVWWLPVALRSHLSLLQHRISCVCPQCSMPYVDIDHIWWHVALWDGDASSNMLANLELPHVCGITDCIFSTWSEWGRACSAECGDGGTQTRFRKLLYPAVNGGKCDLTTSQSRPCNVRPCVRQPVDGVSGESD